MDHTTLRAIHLNNHGAALLLMQNYHRAKEVFLEAMAVCKEGMERLTTDERHKADEGSRECCFLSTEDDTFHPSSCTCTDESCCILLHESSSPPSLSHHQLPEQHVYLHRNPIHVPLKQNTNCTHPLPSLNFLSGTIIFNQALALHLGAMHALHNETTVAGRDELQRAMQMYQVGYAILAEDSYPNPRIVLVTINNLGHGYYTLGRVDIAEKCWEELLSLLMIYVSQGAGFDNFGLEGCFLNLMPQATISCAPAA
jgi:Tetratricopeptide repeat